MEIESKIKEAQKVLSDLKNELHKVIIGQDQLIDRLLIALLADGHILLEGVPGLAKTKTLNTLTSCISANMKRIQFTPDLLPSDLIGTEIFRPQDSTFVVRQGPIFTNLLLADEINRAPAKVQSALLEAMQERQVTIGENTFKLPKPFMVLATQNPIEQEGTYPLPEAQLDRFIMKVKVTYPSYEEEVKILSLDRSDAKTIAAPIKSVISLDQLIDIRIILDQIYVDNRIERYIVSLVQATRSAKVYGLDNLIEWGASPRASLALQKASRALALLRGKTFVTPDEVKSIAHDVLRHRILLSFEAEAKSSSTDDVISSLLNLVNVP